MNKNKGDACTYRYSFEGEEMQQQAVKSTNYPFNPNDAYGELSEKKTQITERILRKINRKPSEVTEQTKAKQMTFFQGVANKLRKKNKTEELISDLESYFPFGLSVRNLFEDVDETSENVNTAPMRMLSTILKIDLEGRNCLEYLENKTNNTNDATENLDRNTPQEKRKRRRKKAT